MGAVLDWLTIIAFVLSTYTFIVQLVSHRKNLGIKLCHMFNWGDNHQVFTAYIEVINKSRLPISVLQVTMEQNGRCAIFDQMSREVCKTTHREGREVVGRESTYSLPFPISLQGLEAKSGLLVTVIENSDFSLFPGTPIVFLIETNRGIVKRTAMFTGFSDHKEYL